MPSPNLLRSAHHRLLRTRAFVEWDAVDVRLLKTTGSVDFTGQERAARNKLTMPSRVFGFIMPHAIAAANITRNR